MRVCFLLLDPGWNGQARAFAEAGAALRERGFEVVMVCPAESTVARALRRDTLEVIEVAFRGRWLRDAWSLRDVLREKFTEVVFVHGEDAQLVAAAGARLAGRASVVRRIPPRGHLTNGRSARLASRLAATGFLFASDEDLRAAKAPARALEPVVAANAAPVAAAASASSDGPVVTCVLDPGAHATQLLALRALALLAPRHPELRVIIAGPESDADALRIQTAALGLASQLVLVHDPAACSLAIGGARLAWLLADGDDFAFAALDAFAAGVPIIAARSTLSARYLTDGHNGLALASPEPSAAASLVARLLADDALHARLVSGARASLERWPRAAMAEGFVRAAIAARDRTRWRLTR